MSKLPITTNEIEKRLAALEEHSHVPFDFTELIERIEALEALATPAMKQITDDMLNAAVGAAWPGEEIIFSDEFDSPQHMMRAALTAALATPANSHAEAISDVLKTLEWMDRKGGLGLDVHHKIDISIRSLRALLQQPSPR